MSYTQLLYHIVFRTKNSVHAIDGQYENILYRYIWGFIKSKGCVLYRIGGMPDHIHLLVQLTAEIYLSGFIRDLKTAATKFMQSEKDKFPNFNGWGKSYCALSCSPSAKDSIINYIKGQKEHHKKISFHDELLAILHENNVDVDMKYFLKE